MKTFRMKVLMMLVACVSLLVGVHVLAQSNMACAEFGLGCQGYNCIIVGSATCTDDFGKSQTWNRLTQNKGTSYYLGHCDVGKGSCKKESFACDSDKYFNPNPLDRICDDNTHKCNDPFQKSGCKNS